MEGQGYHYPNSLFKLSVTIAGHPDVMCVSMWSYMKYTMWSMMYSSQIFDLNLAFETCFQFTGTVRMVRTSQHHHEGATRQIPKMWHFAKQMTQSCPQVSVTKQNGKEYESREKRPWAMSSAILDPFEQTNWNFKDILGATGKI